jgi:tetratricopeptide (TPR) repeat protein
MATRSRRKEEKREIATERRPVPPPKPAAAARPVLWRPHVKLIAALWLLALIPYANSFRTGFPLDNKPVILEDTRIRAATTQNIDLILTKDYWYGSHTTNLYRPLTTLSYLFNYTFLGNQARAAPYHVINFALHTLNIALVYFLGLALFGETAPACALALIWSVHPVLTESVTNIVGRADLLAGFGVLAGLLCHISAGNAAGRRKAVWLAALAAAAAVGIFSKESGIVLLAAMALYDLARPRWRKRLWGYAAAALPITVFLYVRANMLAGTYAGEVPFVDNPLVGAGFWTARLTAVKVIGKYFWLLIWPARLSTDYSYNQVPLFASQFRSWADWEAVLAFVACCAAALIAIKSRRRNGTLFFLIGFFFAALLPTSNLIILVGTIMAERFLYLPAIAFAACVVLLILAVSRRARPPAAVGILAVIYVGFATRTLVRNFDWTDDVTLWTAASRASPASFKVHDSLVQQRLLANPPDLNAAAAEADRSLAILDRLPDELDAVQPYVNAAKAYRQVGDSQTDPSQKQNWYRKALGAALRGERIDRLSQERIQALNAGRRVLSGSAPLYQELGSIWLRLNDPQKALEAFDRSRFFSATPESFASRAEAYATLHDQRQAVIALFEALVYDPLWTQFAPLIVDQYKNHEPQSCALRDSGSGASLDLSCPLVHDEICAAARNVQRLYLSHTQTAKAGATAASAVQGLGCPAGMFQ